MLYSLITILKIKNFGKFIKIKTIILRKYLMAFGLIQKLNQIWVSLRLAISRSIARPMLPAIV
ncbi:hypothetical protein [Marine gokushovirus]|nr:hypothetical protein [Marine gokushovirus]